MIKLYATPKNSLYHKKFYNILMQSIGSNAKCIRPGVENVSTIKTFAFTRHAPIHYTQHTFEQATRTCFEFRKRCSHCFRKSSNRFENERTCSTGRRRCANPRDALLTLSNGRPKFILIFIFVLN